MEKTSGDAADILAFQLAMLEDDALRAPALEAIAGGTPAHEAWSAALGGEILGYESSDDEYFRARAEDLRDIRDRVLRHLFGVGPEAAGGAAVYFGEDMPPTRFLGIDWSQGGAIALSRGSSTSHVAMLARARGIPMVVGLGARRSGGRFPGHRRWRGSTSAPRSRCGDGRAPRPAPRRSCRTTGARQFLPAEARRAEGWHPYPGHDQCRRRGRARSHRSRLLRWHRPDALGVPVPRRRAIAGRGRAVSRLPPLRGVGGRAARHHPHPRHRRRQAGARPHARGRSQSLPRPARRAPHPGAAGCLPHAAARPGPRRGAWRSQGDDPDGEHPRGTGADRRTARRGDGRPAARRRRLPQATARHHGGSARRRRGARPVSRRGLLLHRFQ